MSDNVKTAQTVYEAFGRGDIPAIVDLMADDVEWEAWENNFAQNAGLPAMTRRHGKQGVADFFAAIAPWTVTDVQVLSMMEGPNQVAVEFVIEVDLPNGGHYRDEEIHLITFDGGGKISRWRHYVDTAKHIAANNGERT